MQKRLTFQCWSCDREYSMMREIGGSPQIIVACPYCEKEGVVDLAPDRDNTTSIYKGLAAPATPAVETYDLPAVILTAAPSDQPSSPLA